MSIDLWNHFCTPRTFNNNEGFNKKLKYNVCVATNLYKVINVLKTCEVNIKYDQVLTGEKNPSRRKLDLDKDALVQGHITTDIQIIDYK